MIDVGWIHKELGRLRLEKGETLRYVAKAIGMTHATIHNYESGERRNIITIERLLNYYGYELKVVKK